LVRIVVHIQKKKDQVMKGEKAISDKVIWMHFVLTTEIFRSNDIFQRFNELWHDSGNSGSVPTFSFSDIFFSFF